MWASYRLDHPMRRSARANEKQIPLKHWLRRSGRLDKIMLFGDELEMIASSADSHDKVHGFRSRQHCAEALADWIRTAAISTSQ